MKKILLSLLALLLTTNLSMANPAESKPTVSVMKATSTYLCIPSPFIYAQMSKANMKKTQDIGTGVAGKWQIWSGIQHNKNVWILVIETPNGLSCKIDNSIVVDESTEPTLEDKLKKIK